MVRDPTQFKGVFVKRWVWLFLISCASVPGEPSEAALTQRQDACTERRRGFTLTALSEHSSCRADADCAAISSQDSGRCGVFAQKTLPPALTQAVRDACDSVPQVAIACPNVLSVCSEGRCAKGAEQESPIANAELEARMTASKPDMNCLLSAMDSRDGDDHEAVISATVTELGTMNYFRVIEGSPQFTPQLLWQLSKCRATPALLDGKPIRYPHLIRFTVH